MFDWRLEKTTIFGVALQVFRPHFFPMKSFIWNYGTDNEIEVTDRTQLQMINYELFKHFDNNCRPLAYPHTVSCMQLNKKSGKKGIWLILYTIKDTLQEEHSVLTGS